MKSPEALSYPGDADGRLAEKQVPDD